MTSPRTSPRPSTQSIEASAEAIMSVLRDAANLDYIGEEVSQLDHGLQCAHEAATSGSDHEEILAALFHDIGHLCASPEAKQMAGLGVVDHEAIGADFLLNHGCSNTVAELVRSHVDAKRYLAFKKPAYAARLTEASQETLRWQGGPMASTEAAAFEQDPFFQAKLRLRVRDEAGKVPDHEVPQLDAYRDMLIGHLQDNSV